MSNIYVIEPPTDGKVLFKTTVGDIEVELWSKEAPKACRNFIQLCMEGYYDGTIFHRVIKEFIVQGGDPEGTGESIGESIYGKPFNDEFHSRLRFVRRGLVALANSGKNDNTSHFFFTLAACPELNNKNTIFGRIGGDTIFNMVKLADCETDGKDRPVCPQKIKRVKIISNPFNDIVPRESRIIQEETIDATHERVKPIKNFSLLSFGDEAKEEEDEVIKVSEKFQNKSKSSHDLLNDKNLSSIPAIRIDEDEEEEDVVAIEAKKKATMDTIRDKLKRKSDVADNKNKKLKTSNDNKIGGDDNNCELRLSNSSEDRIKKYKEEAKKLLRDMRRGTNESHDEEAEKPSKPFKLERNLDMFKGRQANLPPPPSSSSSSSSSNLKKSGSKGTDIMDVLSKFKKKIQSASRLTEYDSNDEDDKDEVDKEEDDDTTNKDISWMTHKLVCPIDGGKVLDANIAELERYEIYDPRNPMTQRRKKESSKNIKKQ